MDYLTANNIPCYMTAVDTESGKELLIKGYNPKTRVAIQNPGFQQEALFLFV